MLWNRIYCEQERRFPVSVPAGIDNGQSIRIRGKGEPGVNGGPRGDLLVEVQVSPTSDLPASGYEYLLYCTDQLCTVAALGGTIRIKTVDGEVEYDVKAGTQTDTRVRLQRKRYAVSAETRACAVIIM